ncbi:MAG TPA: glycosyl hydrolase 53 family protein [Ignavibacteriaceae bacterium]|nr:glycosyl hydrolase 53 family protein [Ignavibacteriaceae bacterium]
MNKIRINIYILFIFVLTFQLYAQDNLKESLVKRSEFIKGVDLSVLLEIEEHGGIFKENSIPKDALQIFKDHGINFIRLRLWHTPANGYDNLNRTLLMASRIKTLGLKFLLDLHYSDTWADPGQQTKPTAWQNLSFQSLKDSIYQYTHSVITALKNQNTLPDIVQIGNEITCGMLWNDGRVCDQFNTPQQWVQLAELINEGISGVSESLDPGDSIKIMIHIDRGGDNSGSQWFFDHLITLNVDFDIIGLSYYPWWQGTLSELEFNTDDLAQRYDKEIILVETAYPWTLDWYDNTHNIVGDPSQLLPGYPATVEGQTGFLSDLIELVRNIPDDKGSGLFYWAPEWISVPTLGSPWENVTLFDFTGELLNSISVFDSIPSGIQPPELISDSFNLYQNYPNPFNSKTIINFSVPKESFITLKVFDILGNEITTLVNEEKPFGNFYVEFDGNDLPSGVYFYRMQTGNFTGIKKLILMR